MECDCPNDDVAEPRSMVIREETLQTIYLDIRTVDVSCFYPTAVSLEVAYKGFGWPTETGGYLIKQHYPLGS